MSIFNHNSGEERTLSYFDREFGNPKFHFFCGDTTDIYLDNQLCMLTALQLIHRDLKNCGYRRIVFYDVNSGVFFLDQESKNLWNGEDADAEDNSTGSILDNILGASPIGGSLTSDNPVADEDDPFASVIAESSPVSGFPSIGIGEILRITQGFMLDTKICTAVVFCDGVSVIDELSRYNRRNLMSFLNRISQNTSETVGNRNTTVFLCRGGSNHFRYYYNIGKENQDEFVAGALSKGRCHDIRPVSAAEVRRLLNSLRIYGVNGKKLAVPVKDLDKICTPLSRKIAGNRKEDDAQKELDFGEFSGKSLGDLTDYLYLNYMYSDRQFDMQELKSICDENVEKSALEQLDEMIGMRSVKKWVHNLLKASKNMSMKTMNPGESRLRPNGGSLPDRNDDNSGAVRLSLSLEGNPGTGKTTASKLLGRIFSEAGLLSIGHTIETRPSRLRGTHLGVSGSNMCNAIDSARGGVLFIDEAYGLAVKEENDYYNDVYNKEIINELVGAMTQYSSDISVIVAGYPDKMQSFFASDPGLADRFKEHIVLDDYNEYELTEIFCYLAKKRGLQTDDSLREILPVIFLNAYINNRSRNKDNERWSNGRVAEKLIDRMVNDSGGECMTLTPEHLPDDWKALSAPYEAHKRLESMIGLRLVKASFENLDDHLMSGVSKIGVPSYFFVGNPGTGKSSVATTAGRLLREKGILSIGHTITVRYSDIAKKSADQIERIFAQARDGVLFIDEAYGLAKGAVREDVVQLLLNYTDPDYAPFDVCVICAGYEADMDDLIRLNQGFRSRLTKIVFEDYSSGELCEILRLELSKLGITADEEFFSEAEKVLEDNMDWINSVGGNARFVKTKFFDACCSCCRKRNGKRVRIEHFTAEDVPDRDSSIFIQ